MAASMVGSTVWISGTKFEMDTERELVEAGGVIVIAVVFPVALVMEKSPATAPVA